MHGLRAHLFIAASVASLLGLAWVGQVSPPSRLDSIRQRGELVVATRVGPSTYYEGRSGPEGLEYDLARRFAGELGVSLRVRTITDLDTLFTELDAGRVDLAAAGIGPTPERRTRFAFTEPYMQVHPQLIYRTGTGHPDGLGDLGDGRLDVVAGSAHEERLRALRAERFQGLHWQALAGTTAEELLYRIWSGRADYAVTDSNKLALNQHFYPELRAAFDVGEPRGLAWMLHPDDDALLDAANRFFRRLRDTEALDAVIETYYGHLERFDYVGTRRFMRHTTEQLPRYLATFKAAAERYGVDWRLLAAVGYQESHWEPDAVSPTGVRGLMMLTRNTAEQVGIADRTNPEQSIMGGAAYLKSVRSRLADDIPEPVRTWFALAAYNVGLGHLRDARTITEMRGGDPYSWADVKKNLPLLSQKKWYSQVEHGHARGWEPVRYVENIRKYYQMLVRVTEPGLLRAEEGSDTAAEPADPAGWRLSDELESAL